MPTISTHNISALNDMETLQTEIRKQIERLHNMRRDSERRSKVITRSLELRSADSASASAYYMAAVTLEATLRRSEAEDI